MTFLCYCIVVYPDQYENLWKSCKHEELDSYVFQENPSVQWTLDYWNIAKQGSNIVEEGCFIAEQGWNIAEWGRNIAEQSWNIA